MLSAMPPVQPASPAPGQPSASGELTLHDCGPADRADQLALYNACFRKTLDLPGLVWRYDQNPCGTTLSFVARSPAGQAVSGYACNPRIATARGEHAAVVGETGDVMTHPEWRKRGIFSDLDRRAMAEARRRGWPLVFGFPNRRSAHIFLELGWTRIGTLRPWTLVLRADAAARAERAKEGRLALWGTGLAEGRARRARHRTRARGAGFATTPLLGGFPAEVDALSRRLEARFAWMIRREKPYLDWRFLRAPSGLHRALSVRDGAGRFAGYCVVQLPRPGSAVGYLVDVLAPEEGALAAALDGGLATLEQAGASVVQATAIDGSWWRDVLVGQGFVAPRRANHLTIILHVHDGAHPLAAAARDPRGWYFTDGDRDDETMG